MRRDYFWDHGQVKMDNECQSRQRPDKDKEKWGVRKGEGVRKKRESYLLRILL